MNFKIILSLLAFLFTASHTVRAEEPSTPITKVKRIDVEQYDKLRADTNVVVLDVRSPAEFQTGHIPGATNIDINSSKFSDKIAALDTNKTYLVNCAVGMRSAKAAKKMESMGFNKLYDLETGFDGWKKARKPVEK